ncbi:DNA polymerase IV [Lysinibacillus sp. FSL M8-0216]|uniref:DNA polymerase IV n=1 Tax=Lysinibacillus fusiformis TaxID=28031 RepID=A0A1H9KHP5_9BACI|nr:MULTISPECIES: DNA polymerase IV [Lysinibacillus]MCG7436521.1 DNA polymerase IV [Lysinibacillus fusiformis]MED4670049.1 DNA polymerase IV [Lysinibacillus fusiformis]NOG26948.1 DNA polymerase IV [Lysinibacillus fusiformis]QAS56478.1 DNA polymerase IV [Lysinibacillus sphaericus]RDV31462.1 DNA polymerase IV [Lysinibacillus fusiformis]
MHKGRIILHIDLNCFYASVEQIYDPSLKGKPIAIAGNPKERRGIVITCSYEARKSGVYTTMNVGEARRKCPELIVLPPNFERYRAASKSFFGLLKEYSEILQPVSIDEGYIQLPIIEGQNVLEHVHGIQDRIWNELQLPCSIGIAPNKFLAKMASEMRKPMGITILRKRDVPSVLWPLNVKEMHGIGKSTAEKLKELGIQTIGELAAADEYTLKQKFGINGLRLKQKANGEDDRPVDPEAIYDTKSVGNSTTLSHDTTDRDELYKIMTTLSEKVAERLKAKKLAGVTVSIIIRTASWETYTRSKSVNNAIFSKEDIVEQAWNLFNKNWNEEPVRLLGVTISNVSDIKEMTQQLTFFDFEDHIKDEPIIKLVDQIEQKFGKGVILRGSDIVKPAGKHQANTSFSKDFWDDHL